MSEKREANNRQRRAPKLQSGEIRFVAVSDFVEREVHEPLNGLTIEELQKAVAANNKIPVYPIRTPRGGWVEENPEAVAPEENSGNLANGERNDAIRDLVNADKLGRFHVPKGQGKKSGRFLSVSESAANDLFNFQDDIRGSLAERQKENELFERSKKIVDSLSAIESALSDARDAIQAGDKTEASVIREALVKEQIFGDETARIVGNIHDDTEIIDLFTYAAAQTAQAPVEPTNPHMPLHAPTNPHTPLHEPTNPHAASPTDPHTAGAYTPTNPHAPLHEPTNPHTPLHEPTNPHTPLHAPTAPGAGSRADRDSASSELISRRAELEIVRLEWAEQSAKRHRHAFGRRSWSYQAAEENYNNLSREVAKLELADALSAETDTVQKYALVDAQWISEQNRLRDEAKHFVEDRRRWKVANGFSTIMNRGSRKWRIAKSVALGTVIGVPGLVFFGAGTAAAVGLAVATRFGRATSTRVTGGINQLTSEQANEVAQSRSLLGDQVTNDDIIEHRATRYSDQYEHDGNRLRSRRRGTLMRAGAIAVGGYAAGSGIHYAYDRLFGDAPAAALGKTPGAPGPKDIAPAPGNSLPPPAANPNISAGQGAPMYPDGINPRYSHGEASGSDSGTGGTANGPKVGAGETAPTGTVTGHNLLDSRGVFNVHTGEGWYETFEDMGIPQDKWADVLQDAGPKLRTLGAAYFDQTHQQWYIDRPGTLSKAAIQAIANSSARFGYAFSKIA